MPQREMLKLALTGRLVVDPGVVVKLLGSRIELERGTARLLPKALRKIVSSSRALATIDLEPAAHSIPTVISPIFARLAIGAALLSTPVQEEALTMPTSHSAAVRLR